MKHSVAVDAYFAHFCLDSCLIVSFPFYILNLRRKSLRLVRKDGLFHRIQRDSAPGVSGLLQCSPLPVCRRKYRFLRVTFLCLVKSDMPRAPKETTSSLPFFSNTASHFFAGLCDRRKVLNLN